MTEKAKQLGQETVEPCYVVTNTDKKGEITVEIHDGLTKREYFAVMAMQGLCVNDGFLTTEILTAQSIRHADALLEELSKEN